MNATKSINQSSTKIKKARERVNKAYKKLGSWEKVGVSYGLNKTTLCRFASETDEYIPKNDEIREKIGLGTKETIVIIRERDPITGRLLPNVQRPIQT